MERASASWSMRRRRRSPSEMVSRTGVSSTDTSTSSTEAPDGVSTRPTGVGSDAVGQVRERAGDLYGDIEDYAKDQPLAALAVALGVGLILGFTLRGGQKTVYVRR